MAGLQAVSPEMEIVGCGRVSGVLWQLWKGAVEVTSGLHQNALASSVREKFWKWVAAPECRVGCISPCPFFFTPGVMQLFHGGQLTANYLLNREVNTLELVRGMGGEGAKPDTTMEKRTNAFSYWPGKCDRDWLCFSLSLEGYTWWECLDLANGLITWKGAGRQVLFSQLNSAWLTGGNDRGESYLIFTVWRVLRIIKTWFISSKE